MQTNVGLLSSGGSGRDKGKKVRGEGENEDC